MIRVLIAVIIVVVAVHAYVFRRELGGIAHRVGNVLWGGWMIARLTWHQMRRR